MNRLLLAAAVLAAFTAAAHVFLGTPEIAAPLLNSPLPPETALLLYACWHLVSCSLVLSAAALFLGAARRRQVVARPAARFVSILWLAFGAVFVVVGLFGADGALFLRLPQWMILLPVGVLGLLGSVSSPGSPPSGAPLNGEDGPA